MCIKNFAADNNQVVKNNIVYHLPEQTLDGYTHQLHTEPEGYWLMPGDKLVLLSLEGNHLDPSFVNVREKVRSILGETTVQLTYSDVYDEVHPLFKKSLSWFKRTL